MPWSPTLLDHQPSSEYHGETLGRTHLEPGLSAGVSPGRVQFQAAQVHSPLGPLQVLWPRDGDSSVVPLDGGADQSRPPQAQDASITAFLSDAGDAVCYSSPPRAAGECHPFHDANSV